jgi:hypothetical protein
VPAEVLAGLDAAAATPVDYVAERDAGKPAEQRGSYRVIEDTMTITGKRKADPVLQVRRVLVWSSARAGAAATARARKLERARDDLERLQRGLGSRHYPDADAVSARLAGITRSRRVTGLLRAQVGTDQATGKPTLAWWFDQATLEREQATDGWYGLLTNLDPVQADAAGVLARYKGQEVVERRYGSFKGPLAVAPLFVQSNRRIQALVTVICLALLIFCLVERQVRRAIAPDRTLDGLYVGQPAKPTGRLVFQALARLRLIPASGHDPPIIPQPPPLQARLLELLDVDPTQPPDQLENPMRPNAYNPYGPSCAKDPASAVSGNVRPFCQLTKGAVVGVAVAPWARGSQGLEVPGHGKQGVARLLIDAPCGSMTRVTARLDHCHRHPSLAQPARGHLGQGGADAATLLIRIDGQHPELPDLALWVELGGDEADDPSRRLSDPDLGRGISEGVANVLFLVLPPVAMQADEDLATQALRQGAEHRSPCPKRQLDNGLLVERPIVADTGVHEQPSLHVSGEGRPDHLAGMELMEMVDTSGLQPGRRPRDRAAVAQDGQATPGDPWSC